MVKLKSGRLARTTTDACLQVIGEFPLETSRLPLQYWGGNGFTWNNPVSRFYRDLRLFSIGAGCDEVMLNIISKYMAITD